MSTIAADTQQEGATQTKEVTFLEAISQALWEEMERDKDVFLLGEDIGTYGGAFKVTEGFLEHFGGNRVIDTPLAESAIFGAAIGAALMGMRPVAEAQYADFMTCGFDQIVNEAAKYHYRSGHPVPVVFRAPSGGGVRGGPFHSQSPEAWYAHTPGLKVIVPSTPTDAKGLMKSAIRDNNPVVFLEHKYLYRHVKEVLPDGDYTIPIGSADVKRSGNDLTIVTYGAMVHKALDVAGEMAESGQASIEVVDLRTLLPLDTETILRSVKKTSRVLLLQEDVRSLGISSEVAAIIAEEGFEYLDAPVVRITAPNAPVPFSAVLEDAFIPQKGQIKEAVERLLAY